MYNLLCVINLKSTIIDQVYQLKNDPLLQSSVMVLIISCKVNFLPSQSYMRYQIKTSTSTRTQLFYEGRPILSIFFNLGWFISKPKHIETYREDHFSFVTAYISTDYIFQRNVCSTIALCYIQQ